jgi:hypothetical protein
VSRAEGLANLSLGLSPCLAMVGFQLGNPLLLPVFCAAPAYLAMAIYLRAGRRRRALTAMLAWALALGAVMTSMCVSDPARAERVVIHGPAYWEEMHPWLETGQGRESDPARFLPQHALHAAVFIALSLATASTLSVLFGAVLMNYMAYYVSRVVLLTPAHPFAAAVLGWNPWSVVRIIAYVILGVVLAEPLLARLTRTLRPPVSRALLGAAAGGLVLDVLLKALLAPHWAGLLRGLR